MKVLVLNCGSSSIKYKLFDMTSVIMAQGGIKRSVCQCIPETDRQRR